MEFIPKSKSDLSAIEKLSQATNDEIKPYLSELLEWLQDINWPVALPVAECLAKSGKEITPFIDSILAGKDQVWKYHVIVNLIPRLQPEIMESSMSEIVRIINEPTEAEIAEEVQMVARDAMFIYSHSV